MKEYFEDFTAKCKLVFLQCQYFLCALGTFVKYETVSTTLSIRVSFNLGWSNGTVGLEEIEELLLGCFSSQIADKEVSVSIEWFILLLKRNAELFSVHFKVVHSFCSAFRFFLVGERNKTVVKWFLREVIEANSCADRTVAFRLEKLFQLEIEEIGREVGNVNRRRALFFLRTIATAVLLLLMKNTLKHLLHSSVSSLRLSRLRTVTLHVRHTTWSLLLSHLHLLLGILRLLHVRCSLVHVLTHILFCNRLCV